MTYQGSFQPSPKSCPKYFQWCILFLNRHSSIKSTCVGLSISFFAPHVSNKLNNSRSLESGFDVTQSYLCSSSNLPIYKLLPRLSSKPLMCTAFRQICTMVVQPSNQVVEDYLTSGESELLLLHWCGVYTTASQLLGTWSKTDFILAMQRA